jgi:pectate lyase
MKKNNGNFLFRMGLRKKQVIVLLLLLFGLSQIFSAPCADVNSDSVINIVDALMIAQHFVGLNPQGFDQAAADVSGDGIINIVDALQIAQYAVGLLSSFNGCKPTPPPTPTPGSFDELIGWASVSGSGITTTTGGGNTTPVVVKSLSDLNSQASGSTARVIHVDGQFSGTLKVGSNKTIIGLPGAKITSSGAVLQIGSSTNVIIKNMHFQGSPDGSADMANINGGHHIWIDHCNLVNGGDGMLDIVGTSDFITISWCKLWYTAQTAHQNAILLASSNGSSESRGHMNITFHHNWWAENVTERMPRVRFGKVHILNNLYEATLGWTYYAIRCGYEANVLSENNVYKDFTGNSKAYNNGATLVFNYFDGSSSSVLESNGDVFINCTASAKDYDGVLGGTFDNGDAFTPPYSYAPAATDSLEALIKAGAGPR